MGSCLLSRIYYISVQLWLPSPSILNHQNLSIPQVFCLKGFGLSEKDARSTQPASGWRSIPPPSRSGPLSGSTSTSIHSTRPWLSNPSIPLQLAMEWSGLTRWTKLIYFGAKPQDHGDAALAFLLGALPYKRLTTPRKLGEC